MLSITLGVRWVVIWQVGLLLARCDHFGLYLSGLFDDVSGEDLCYCSDSKPDITGY